MFVSFSLPGFLALCRAFFGSFPFVQACIPLVNSQQVVESWNFRLQHFHIMWWTFLANFCNIIYSLFFLQLILTII